MVNLAAFLHLVVLLNYSNSANILGFFMFPSISHQIVYQPIWKELSLRGHQVTVVTPNPLHDPNLENLTEIDVSHAYEVFKTYRLDKAIPKEGNPFFNAIRMYNILRWIIENELNNPQVQSLLNDVSRHFDLIILECHHPGLYGLAGIYKAPIICVTSLGMNFIGHQLVGNPTHPALYPDILLNFQNDDLNMKEKVQSTIFDIWRRIHYRFFLVPESEEIYEKFFQFRMNLSRIHDLEKYVNMYFVNVNPLLHSPRPNVPSVIELRQMHIKPVSPLPEDLQKILEEATEGVIYFSLGTNVKSVDIPERLLHELIKTFDELSYRILWKWESDNLVGKPDNVIIRKWFPQQDILAHKNVKVFVTQGGLQSIEEAIARRVPIVGLPFFVDQPMNVRKIVKLGIGLGIDPAYLTKDKLKKAILEVAENSTYKNKMEEVHQILKDQPMTSLETAVWWCEYVVRHKGAKHLRSPTADISLFNYLLLDVILILLLSFVAVFCILYHIAKFTLLVQKKNKVKQN